jgi:multidrug efflux pump subunit AcrA (membrane-fusion protein)
LHAASERLKQAAAGRPGLIAQQELDDAEAKDLASQAQVDAAKSAMAAAQEHAGAAQSDNQRVEALHNYTNVTAPLDGVVIWRYADTGALIQGGTNSNEQALAHRAAVAEQPFTPARPGARGRCEIRPHRRPVAGARRCHRPRSFTGKIVRFTREVNFETRTMETEVDVENKDLSISPGMYANTLLQLAHVTNVVTIPVEALVLSGPTGNGLRSR